VSDITRSAEADPHAGGSVLRLGPPPERSVATLIMLHGRGGTAESIASLYPRLDLPNVAVLAPQAAGNSWYPNRFLSPLETNQPWIDSALRRVDLLVDELIALGVSTDRIGILGFSQGACLASEYVVRQPRKYGAVMILTGSVFGPLDLPRGPLGSLEGTPVFIGASDPDELVPLPHVERTARLLEQLGGDVDFRVYAGKPHTVSEAELAVCRALIEGIN
jgi:phospholipase/carboxylesterase